VTDKEQFYRLQPEAVMRAAEAAGYEPTGQFIQLNSLENRVYSVGVEDGPGLVLKFYRPERWSAAQIGEEHGFARELALAGVPVCAPLDLPAAARIEGQAALGSAEGIYFAAWEKAPGRIPDEFTDEMLFQLGRSIALLHEVGAKKLEGVRPVLDSSGLISAPLDFLLESGAIHPHFRDRYAEAARAAARALDKALSGAPRQRIHGDCHWGNLLYDGKTLRFLDFDDFRYGPPAQDIWMITPAIDAKGVAQREILLSGYRSKRPFEESWLGAVNPLKAGRYVHYAAWIARRWEDPSFKNAFPAFGGKEYWEGETRDLEALLTECAPREELPPALAEEAEDVSKLTNKDYFYDME
jgi:Ser/Thr protein kinase RdoA (MazF antagonist)